MRILMVTPRYGGASGLGTAVQGLTRALAARRHLVDVLHLEPGRTSAVTLLDHAGWHRRPRPLEQVLEWEREFDVVHFHGDACSDGRDGGFGRICRRHPGPVVVTLHSLAHEYQAAIGASRWRAAAQAVVQADLVERASAVLVLTEESRREMIRRFPARRRAFHVVGNGVDPPGPRPAGWGWLRRDLGWGPDCRVLLFLGRLGREKGVVELAEAFVRLHRIRPELRLVLAGPAVDDSLGRAEAVLAAGRLRREVEYVVTGPVDAGTRNGLLADAAAVVLPSRTEQLPLSALEAMAHGRPCLVTALPALRRLWRLDEPAERLAWPIPPPPTPAAIRRAVLAVLDGEDVPALVGRAQRAVRERFRWSTVVAATLAVYRAVRGRRPVRRAPDAAARTVLRHLRPALQPGSGAECAGVAELAAALLNFRRAEFRDRGGIRRREDLREAGRLAWLHGLRVMAGASEMVVIIPVHLGGRGGRGCGFLAEAVASVLAQDVAARVAVVVVDDGSPCDVRGVLAGAFPRWSGTDGAAVDVDVRRRVRLWVLRLAQHTGHPGLVRLAGYQWALRTRTPFIAHLDADDRMLPHRLRVSWDHLRAHPTTDLVHAAHRSIGSTGRVLTGPNTVDRWFAEWRRGRFGLDPADERHRGRFHRHSAAEIRALTEGANFVHNATVFFRTEALLRLGEEALVPSAPAGREDHELWVKLSDGGKLDYLNDVVGLYRQHAASLSARAARR